jgi:hypothetical protein
MRRRIVFLVCLALAAGLIALLGGGTTHTAGATSIYSKLAPIQQRILSGFLSNELNPAQGGADSGIRSQAPTAAARSAPSSPAAFGCPSNLGANNVRVNQNCLNISDPDLQGRGQAQNETAIAHDPSNQGHLVASYNDYRRGDATCGASYSTDNGLHWRDATMPNGFTRGGAFGGVARQYWQAGGDTSVAWDTKGNAYLSCQVFMRGDFGLTNNPDASSAFYVFRSTQSDGASWNFTGRPVAELNDVGGSFCCLLDKQYLTVDNHVGSPFQDRIYVTWTLFDADFTAYIYEAYSSDYGETFSAPVLVSRDSPLCPNDFGIPTPNGRCNENQFSQPFTGQDGALYVVYTNYNNALAGPHDNRNQFLLVKSTDGGVSFGAPVKVADFYDLPDCATYQGGQDPGRACVPEKGSSTKSVFRASNYASGAVDPTNASRIAVAFGSYINPHSKGTNGCTPDGFAPSGQNKFTGVKQPGACNNDILLSVSTNGGGSFTGTTTDPRSLRSVNQATGQATTDQFWQWADFLDDATLAVSYYDRQYGNDEQNGYSDFSLSRSANLTGFSTKRVTSSSMPPPTQFTNAQGNGLFFGDYTGLTAGDDAHPIWMDTRTVDLFLCPGTATPGVPPALCTMTEASGLQANDEDVFTANVGGP